MRKKLIVIGLISAITAAPAFAEGTTSKQEAAGIGAGATVGAIVGGPVGLMIGAAIGAKLGDEFHQKSADVDTLSTSLIGSQARVRDLETDVHKLNADIDALGADLQRMQATARPELLTLMQAGIEMDLLFRTDEHVLAGGTSSRLTQLAASLANMPDVFIQLDGFADERGDTDYNQKLSQKRVEHVRGLLLASGVTPSRIKHSAHGESPAAEANIDSYALERKVSLTLYVGATPSFAANPN